MPPISCPIKTMGDAMKSKRNPDKPAIDLENICVCLMMIGQRRQLELGPLFDYELSAVPVSRIEFTLKSSVYWPIIGLGRNAQVISGNALP